MNEIRVSLLISLFHMHFKFWIFLLIMSGFFLLANAQISANNLSAESSNYTEGCQSIATISYEDRPNIDFTMVSTDTPEHSYPGVVHEYQMNIDFKDVNCGPVVQVDISSIAPVNDYCFVEGISFEAPLSQAKTDASSIINCTNACGQDSECVAQRFVQEYSNSKKTNITNQVTTRNFKVDFKFVIHQWRHCHSRPAICIYVLFL
ncbi:uncharacterized protein LOC111702057 isoform X1 [Eurytemora carolleeae]|uniref:uncharacterized protein LOC111702057 isoform X1 n=1 Tax=Eurytemora carolleeae TaxID=1294199 RepID=UPI000C7613DA|nr:uncharacterized protein LOC111702057 isoform X1 [Eurytemora carolleeae]|eukprot:XP_023329382.1 uncharacterized protein LOC111702057 isoform X1 [Eurytemora affinis]